MITNRFILNIGISKLFMLFFKHIRHIFLECAHTRNGFGRKSSEFKSPMQFIQTKLLFYVYAGLALWSTKDEKGRGIILIDEKINLEHS